MLKKQIYLILFFACLPYTNVFGFDSKTINKIHNYYNEYQEAENKEQYKYNFDEPKVIKLAIKEIAKQAKANGTTKYESLIKSSDPVIKEAAAYYYCADIVVEKNYSFIWQTTFLNQYISLLKDNNLNIRRAAYFSLCTIFLKCNLNKNLEDKIFEQINITKITDRDPFIFGYSLLSMAKRNGVVGWASIRKHYNHAHRFVRLCTIKVFLATAENEIAASWGYDFAYTLKNSDDIEKLKDFKALCTIFASTEEYCHHVYVLAWNKMCEENINNKLAGFATMANIFKGSSLKIGEQFYIKSFISTISLEEKRRIYIELISQDCKSKNLLTKKAALKLCAQFVTRIDDQFDFEVIQDLALNAFEDDSDDIKICAIKILVKLVCKKFDLNTAKEVAKKALRNKNINTSKTVVKFCTLLL